MTEFSATLSPLDEGRFAVRTVQARAVDSDHLAELENFCQANQAQLAIVRVSADALNTVQLLEEAGYRLMDTLVYYTFRFAKKTIPTDVRRHPIRMLRPEDREEVIAIAKESFKGYFGHYHADSRLPKDKCDEVYVDWATNSLILKELGHQVIGVEEKGRLNSFLSFKVNCKEEVEVMLSGILQHAQGKGIHQALMIQATRWAHNYGAHQIIVSTQVTNSASQKAWTRIGFEVDKAYYTLHKWF